MTQKLPTQISVKKEIKRQTSYLAISASDFSNFHRYASDGLNWYNYITHTKKKRERPKPERDSSVGKAPDCSGPRTWVQFLARHHMYRQRRPAACRTTHTHSLPPSTIYPRRVVGKKRGGDQIFWFSFLCSKYIYFLLYFGWIWISSIYLLSHLSWKQSQCVFNM